MSDLDGESYFRCRMPLSWAQDSLSAVGRHQQRRAGTTCAEWGLPGCAGIVRTADFLDMTDTDFDAVLDVNLKGAFIVRARISCCHIACMPYAEYLLHR